MLKSVLKTAAKLLLAAVLITWLIRSGKLDFRQLERLVDDTTLLLATLSYYIICSAIFSTWRWKTLLQAGGFKISWARAIQLQLTGLFFNSIMPGAVGGDIIKIAYVIRDNPGKSKTQVMMTALLDRIVGLSGLFLVSWVMICFNRQTVLAIKGVWPLITLLGSVSLGFILFFTAALYHYRGHDPFVRILNLNIPGFAAIAKLYAALRAYRHTRSAVVVTVLLSIAIQGISMLTFYLMTTKIVGFMPEFGKIAVIYPVGILTTAIPLTPSGLGVGHIAFTKLFEMVGLEHGASVFNMFVFSQLFLNMLGVIPYLSLRKLKTEEI